jgi:hypothetical protein
MTHNMTPHLGWDKIRLAIIGHSLSQQSLTTPRGGAVGTAPPEGHAELPNFLKSRGTALAS